MSFSDPIILLWLGSFHKASAIAHGSAICCLNKSQYCVKCNIVMVKPTPYGDFFRCAFHLQPNCESFTDVPMDREIGRLNILKKLVD